MTTITEQLDLAASPGWPYPGVATVHALVTALGLNGEPIAQQEQAVRQFTETPAWETAPPVLQRDVRRWLGLLYESQAQFSGGETITGQAAGTAGIAAQVLGLARDDAATDSPSPAGRGYELNPRSGMISLDLPPGVVTPVPGGVSDHHITVVYLGPDVDDEAFAEACLRAQAAAAQVPGPLTGIVGGIGTFPPSDGRDGKVPAWAGVVLPGAERLRAALEDLSASEHPDWRPHVTVAYVDPGGALPSPVPSMQVSFSHLSVHRGDDEVMRYPIGGEPGQAVSPETISGQAAGDAGT